ALSRPLAPRALTQLVEKRPLGQQRLGQSRRLLVRQEQRRRAPADGLVSHAKHRQANPVNLGELYPIAAADRLEPRAFSLQPPAVEVGRAQRQPKSRPCLIEQAKDEVKGLIPLMEAQQKDRKFVPVQQHVSPKIARAGQRAGVNRKVDPISYSFCPKP